MTLKGKIASVALTDTGKVREHNEDMIGSEGDIGLFVLADGMGGYNAGEVASGIAVKTIINLVRDAFLREADQADRPVRTLCMTLAYAGCRLSEALALTADRVDLAAGVLVFESLKNAAPGFFAACPYPLPCSIQSTWCTASANRTQDAARAVVCGGSGRGRG